MRVLLVSPLPDVDPYCGDVVYTESLLKNPPAGVTYVPYTDALKAGDLLEFGRRDHYARAHGIHKVTAIGRIAFERGVNYSRKRGLLFREPFRHFGVRPGRFDLVHCHVFSCSFRDLDTPLVLSNANLIEELYTGARGWSHRRVRTGSLVDLALAKLQNVQHTSLRMPQADGVVAFTDTLRRELVERGAASDSRMHVAPCFVERSEPHAPSAVPMGRVGFIAGDFNAKGGRTVIEAFKLLSATRPEAKLTIIGSPVQPSLLTELGSERVEWVSHVPRAELLSHYLTSFDVLAYPTECDGLPLTVLEAMAAGVPIATSDYRAMPEIVGSGKAGSVSPRGDATALARALDQLLEPVTNRAVRLSTATWYENHYSPDAAVKQLARAYEAALNTHGGA